MASSGDIPTATRLLIHQRSGGRCERCGRPAHQIHHRRPRGMGGTARRSIHAASNLVDLCNECHDMIESDRAYAREHGWLLAPLDDAHLVPVRIQLWGCPMLLDDDGMYVFPSDYHLVS